MPLTDTAETTAEQRDDALRGSSIAANKQVSVHLPAALADKLDAAAEERDVSKSRLVARAVEKYLDALPPLESVLP